MKIHVRGGIAPAIKPPEIRQGEFIMKTQTAILTKDEKAILNTYRKLDKEKKEAAAYHCNYLLKHEPRKEFDFQTLANLNLDGLLHEIGYID